MDNNGQGQPTDPAAPTGAPVNPTAPVMPEAPVAGGTIVNNMPGSDPVEVVEPTTVVDENGEQNNGGAMGGNPGGAPAA